MLSWELEAVINVALLGLALWVSRRPRPRRALWRLVLAYGALLVGTSVVGTAFAMLLLLDPFAGETVDPSPSALSALGIPEPVSWAATGVTAFLIPTIFAIVMLRWSDDDSSRSQGDVADPTQR